MKGPLLLAALIVLKAKALIKLKSPVSLDYHQLKNMLLR